MYEMSFPAAMAFCIFLSHHGPRNQIPRHFQKILMLYENLSATSAVTWCIHIAWTFLLKTYVLLWCYVLIIIIIDSMYLMQYIFIAMFYGSSVAETTKYWVFKLFAQEVHILGVQAFCFPICLDRFEPLSSWWPYLIFVIFFTLTLF